MTEWPHGTGEMAGRIRTFDWARTPLSALETRSERLKLMVEQVLAIPQVSTLVCGPEHLLIYNDAAARLYRDRHPAALGRPLPETFPDGWATVASLYERAFAGETVHVTEQPLDTRGEGGATEVFDALLTPVREAEGQVAYVHMIGFGIAERVRAGITLQESEARFRTLADAAPALIWRNAEKGQNIFINRHFVEFTGEAAEAIRGEGWHTIVHPDDVRDYVADYRAAVRERRMWQHRTRIRRHDGQWRWFENYAHPLRGEDSTYLGHVGVSTDVTPLVEAETALRESEERHRLLIGSWAQAVWETDADGVVVADSPSWRAYTGQTPEEWLGYGWLNAIHPDDRAYAERQWREAVQVRGLVNAEFRLRAPDGGWRWTNVRAAPVLDASGRVGKWAGMNIDIDARRRAETALRESEGRFRALVTAGAYILYRMSPDWRQMHQLSGRDLLVDTSEPLKDWADTYLLPEDRPIIFAAIAEAISAKSPYELEHRVRLADGGVGWVLSRAVPLLDDAGEIKEWFGVGSDVTERREAQDKIRRAEEVYRESLEHQVQERTAELTASRDLLQATMDSSMDMIQVFEAIRDAAGEIVDFRWILNNHTSETKYGEVRGQSLLQRNPGVVQEGIFDAFKHVAETGEPVSAERHYVHEQFDGWFFQSAVKLGDGVATTTKEITAWKAAQAEVLRLQEEIAQARLRESEERLRQFGEASSDVLWIRDAETLQWTYLTPAFETIYGLERETALRDNNMTGWLDLIVPEDRQTALDSIQRVRAGEPAAFEYRIRRPSDGSVRWLRNTDFPMRDAAGRVCWLGGVGRDITEEKAAIHRQQVLVNELQHRARNLLGVVTAVAGRTLREGGSVAAFEDRLQALSRAQALLSQAGSDTVEVGAMVRAELAAHAQDGSERVRVDGPEVQLTARQVQNFALALHELTTNAVKYGALKDGTGWLTVTWEIVLDRRGRPHLALSWVERGVAVNRKAARRGYGTELIQEALAYALEADVDYDLAADGVRCRIAMPVGQPE